MREAIRLVDHLPEESPGHSQRLPVGNQDLFVRLLRATAKSRQASGTLWLAEAEDRIDRLGEAFAALRREFAERVQNAKLASMAEFAAGARPQTSPPPCGSPPPPPPDPPLLSSPHPIVAMPIFRSCAS